LGLLNKKIFKVTGVNLFEKKMAINIKIENKHMYLFAAMTIFLLGVGLIISGTVNTNQPFHSATQVDIGSGKPLSDIIGSDGKINCSNIDGGSDTDFCTDNVVGMTCETHSFGKYAENTWNSQKIPDKCVGGICTYIITYNRLGTIKTEMNQMYMSENGQWARDVDGSALSKVNGDSNEWRLISISYGDSVGSALDDDRNDIKENKVNYIGVYTRKNNYITNLTICY